MEASTYRGILKSSQRVYQEDNRPWLLGYSGGKDSRMVVSVVFDAVLSVLPDQCKNPIAILCDDTCVEIRAIGEIRRTGLV